MTVVSTPSWGVQVPYRLTSFCRLTLFHKRGTGLSDRVTSAATLEERMDDIRAVMDAAGSATRTDDLPWAPRPKSTMNS